MKYIKSAFLFSLGFFSAVIVPLAWGIDDRMTEIDQIDDFVRNEFNCGENPDAAPTGGTVCPKFYNVQIGGGWNDADGGVSLSSKGDIFLRGRFFVDAPGTEEYGGVIFGNNGLYAEGYNGSGLVAVSYNPDGNSAEGRVATWVPNPNFPGVYYNYGLFTPDNARVEGNLLANTLIAQQGDGVMHIYASGRRTVVHGDLEVTGHITECTECAPGLNFTVSPTVIVEGDVTTLTWSSTDADTVTISNAGNCPDNGQPNGNCSLAPTRTTTYTAVARNNESEIEETVSRTVDVFDLTITAVPNNISQGEPVTLSWSTQEAVSITIFVTNGNPLPGVCPVPEVNESQSCSFRVDESLGFIASAIHETGMPLVKRTDVTVTVPVEYIVENTSELVCGPDDDPVCVPPVYAAAVVLCDLNDALLECLVGQPIQMDDNAGCQTRDQQNQPTTARARCLDSAEPYDR